jgi:small subunit ribosomal protein S3
MTSERKFIEENVKRVLLKEYLKRKTERSGFGGLDVQRTPMGTRVTLIAERPGMVIGRKGETIKELTDHVQNHFKFDNPQIEVKEESNPNLNPHIMAQKLASALERGWHFRRAGHSTVRRIMSAGAKGCQVIISGKLTGQRHRTEKFREGHIKYCGETKLTWMLEGFAVAKKKLGVIGIKVQIMDPNAKLPDEIELKELKDVAVIKTETAEVADVTTEEVVGEDVGAEVADTDTAAKTEVSPEGEDKKTTTEKGKEKGKKKAKDKDTKKEKAADKKKKSTKKAKEAEDETAETTVDEPVVETEKEQEPESKKEPAQEKESEPEPPETQAEAQPESAPETNEADTAEEPAPAPEPEKESTDVKEEQPEDDDSGQANAEPEQDSDNKD